MTPPRVTPDLLLDAYAHGIFPMAESAQSEGLAWFDPEERGILPLDERFHIPRRLARKARQNPYEIRFDTSFERVMRLCAEQTEGRKLTWINEEIVSLYTALHRKGFAHSVETFENGELAGGLYGVHLGAAFFGESMFSRRTDASKIALIALVERLRRHGFRLLDTQFLTGHLAQFGALEIPRDSYKKLLNEALARKAVF